MSWNYRVMADVTSHGTYYKIIECYYNEAGEPTCYCEGSIDGWDNLDDLKGTLDLMLKAFDKSILDESQFRVRAIRETSKGER